MKNAWIVFFITIACLMQSDCYALKTSTGFYYPLDNFEYSLSGTWPGSGNGSAGPHGHIGVDMLAPADTKVRAIADGSVYRVSLNGWDINENSKNNIAVLIKHTLSDGSWFIVLYGHVKKENAIKSGMIKAGETVGFLGYYGDEPHLHFGVVDVEKYPTGTFGYSSSDNHNNFINPIVFIKNNPPGFLNSSTTLQYFRVGNLAWYPSNSSCMRAERWVYFRGGYPNGGMSTGDCNICKEKETEMVNALGGYLSDNNWWEIIYGWYDIDEYKTCE